MPLASQSIPSRGGYPSNKGDYSLGFDHLATGREKKDMGKNDQSMRTPERQEGKAEPMEPTLQTVTQPLRLLLTIPEVACALSMRRTKAYTLLNSSGGIPVVRIGRSVRVSVTDLQR